MGFGVIVGDPFGRVGYADNFSFDGSEKGGVLEADGQLWIGSVNSPRVKRGTITSPFGSVIIGFDSPNITLEVAGIVEIFNADDGTANPTDGIINIFGTATGIDTFASGNSIFIDFNISEVPSIAISYSGDTGSATAALNNLNFIGGNDIVTTALGDTVTIDFSGEATELTFASDLGTAAPIDETISILGGNNIATSATGSVLTIDFTGETTEVTFVADTGSAQSVDDIINILGTENGISTTAFGSTIVIDFDILEVPDIAITYGADDGSAIPDGNNLNLIGGNGIVTNVSPEGDGVIFNFTGSPEALNFETNIGTAVPANDILRIEGDQLGIVTSGETNRVLVRFDVTALPTIPVAFATDNAVAQPSENVLDITGGTPGIKTRALGSEVLIDFIITELSSIATSFIADNGSATPSGNNLLIVGGEDIVTTATGNSLVIDFTGAADVLSFAADTGTAVPANAIINILGSSNGIVTDASGDTVSIDFDVTQSPAICTRFFTDFGNAIPNNNNISFTGSADISVTATGSIVSIGFTGDPADLQFTTNDGTAISTQGNINFNGTQGITTAASNDTVILGFDVSQQPEIVTSLVGDSGFALPFDNNINLFTGPGLSTQGSSSTISFNFHVDQLPAIPTEFIVDSGSSAIPVGNSLKIEGGNDIVTSSVGDVVLISFNGSVEDLTFNTNNGTAQADSGIINVLGGSPEGVITTRGFNDNIFIDFNPNFFPTIPVSFTTDIGIAVPADNNLNIRGGNNVIVQGIDDQVTINFTGEGTGLTFGSDVGSAEPDVDGLINFFGTPSGIGTFASGNAIGFTFDINGQPTIPNEFQTDAGSATPTFNSLRLLGGTNIQTVASNDSVTFNFTGSPEGVDYGTDNGVARAENGVINFFGSTGGIDTFAIGNAIGIDFDVNEVPLIATTYISDSGNARPTFNELIISGGNNIQTSASGKTVTINVGPEIQEQLDAILMGLKAIHESGVDLPLETMMCIGKRVA